METLGEIDKKLLKIDSKINISEFRQLSLNTYCKCIVADLDHELCNIVQVGGQTADEGGDCKQQN